MCALVPNVTTRWHGKHNVSDALISVTTKQDQHCRNHMLQVWKQTCGCTVASRRFLFATTRFYFQILTTELIFCILTAFPIFPVLNYGVLDVNPLLTILHLPYYWGEGIGEKCPPPSYLPFNADPPIAFPVPFAASEIGHCGCFVLCPSGHARCQIVDSRDLSPVLCYLSNAYVQHTLLFTNGSFFFFFMLMPSKVTFL